jgi:UDP-glucose 4-epimerase
MKNIEVVFHLAASVGNQRSIEQPLNDAEINVLGTLNILEAARREGVRKIVASSSAGIFGEPKILPMKEDHPQEPLTPYGSSKLCMEKECLAYANLYPIEAVCLRYFNVYGPNQRCDEYGNVIPKFVFNILRNRPITIFGDGEQSRDFVHVQDVIQANLNAADAVGLSGAFNIGSGVPRTLNQLIALLEEVCGLCPKIVMAPEREGDVRHSLADISAARQVLNFKPIVDMAVGIKRYVEWAAKEISREAA